MTRFLSACSAIALLYCSASAQAADSPLSPRVETGFRLGTERGIATTEIWVPFMQAPDRVLYGDARLSGDDRDNFEGNLGGGYRHIYGDTVLGAHAWIDRRKTARGSSFSQAAAGAEILGRTFDARLNGYIPLSGSETYSIPNVGRDEPYLAGSGVFYDTTGTLVEEPQGGFDIEFGYRLPILKEEIDSIRVYAGGYHFAGEDTPDTTGWRTRISMDVTNWLQAGARFQKDAERGSQGFLEATLRFPGKAGFRQHGLRARLDESPERDIDIVTGSEITDTGIAKPILNESGDPLRILHVDNTNGGSGNGTKNNPYSTLKAAEAAMKAYDVIYVHEGDGTTAGQNLGIVIDKPNVKLIGSGVDLVIENNRVTGAATGTTTGTVLAAATAAPVITNTQASGDGVLVTADESLVSGLSVNGAQRDGIRIWATGAGATWNSVNVNHITANANAGRGVLAYAAGGAAIDVTTLEEISASGNTGSNGRGIEVRSEGAGSTIGRASVTAITGTGNNSYAALIYAVDNGRIEMGNLSDITATGNAQAGVLFYAVNSGEIGGGTLHDIAANANGQAGVWVYASNLGQIGDVSLRDIEAEGNAATGITIQAQNGRIETADLYNLKTNGNTREGLRIFTTVAGSAIDTINVSGLISQNNTGAEGRGISIFATNSAQIGSARLYDSILENNSQHGVWLLSQSSGALSAFIEQVTVTGNALNGVYVDDDTTGAFTVDLGGGALGGTGSNRIYSNTGTDIRVDLDGGQLKAENNWWGNAAGLLPARVTLDAGGNTIDADPFLAADPAP